MSEEVNHPKDRAKSIFSPTGVAVRLAIAWLWVGIPLAIGVALTVKSSVPLFRTNPPAMAPAVGK